MGEEDKSESQRKQEKKPRKRMKAILTRIKEQMEFYFSDSNLLKDRFLKKKMDEATDSYVELEIFLSFNRIKAMTTEIDILRKALSKSSILQLNEEKTKVTRTTPLKDLKDVDDRTVYVECLPLGTDHDWVRRVFSACGQVLYVSLPKYKSTGDSKGFAFVEFDTVESAEKACEILNNPPADATDQPGHFPKTSKTLSQLEKQLPATEEPASGKQTDTKGGGGVEVGKADDGKSVEVSPAVKTPGSKRERKRHRQVSECSSESNEDSVSRKKQKVGDTCDPHPPVKTMTPETPSEPIKEQKVKRKRHETPEGAEGGAQKDSEGSDRDKGEKRKSQDTENSPPKKQPRKDPSEDLLSKKIKKRKSRQRKRKNKEKEVPEIRVISKHKWLSLRNEYIALQKANMSKLKQNLMARREAEKQKAIKEKEPKTELVFVAGVIVELKSEAPLKRSALRDGVCKHGEVAYIDVKDGLTQGHIRCVDAESASKIIQAAREGCSFQLLTGEQETQYWEKLKLDRANKFNTKAKPKKRGTQKLIERGEKAQAAVIQGKHKVFADD